jgi:hypothetical protein
VAWSGCENSRRSRRFGDNDELPDDVEDDENCVAIPDKRKLGLRDQPCLLLEIEERHSPGGLNRINDSLSALGCEGVYFERGKRRPADHSAVSAVLAMNCRRSLSRPETSKEALPDQ